MYLNFHAKIDFNKKNCPLKVEEKKKPFDQFTRENSNMYMGYWGLFTSENSRFWRKMQIDFFVVILMNFIFFFLTSN